MKHYFSLLLSSSVVVLGSVACSVPKQSEDVASAENAIRMGKASLTVNLDAATSADSLRLSLFSRPLLFNDASNDPEWCQLERNGNTWTGEIAMDMTRKDGNVLVVSKIGGITPLAQINVGLDQDNPLILSFSLDADGRISDAESSGGTGFTDWQNTLWTVRDNLTNARIAPADPEVYRDCEKFARFYAKPEILEATDSVLLSLPASLAESIRQEFDRRNAAVLMSYRQYAVDFGGDIFGIDSTEISNPPVDYYRFLNTLDYSSSMLNDLSSSTRHLVDRILNIPALGIAPIADTPIAEWQSQLNEKLTQVIDDPTPLLIDLLTIDSYLQQIEYDHVPLTDTQIGNIKAHYSESDIVKFLIDR